MIPFVDEPIEREIARPDKGLTMRFYPSRVVKCYNVFPTCITIEDRDRRYHGELAAYRRFAKSQCPFVPELLGTSIEDKCLSIAKVNGRDLLAITQENKPLPIRSILKQLDQMNRWLRSNGFGDMENNIKDMILAESGQLYLIDFEPYTADEEPLGFLGLKPDIYNAAINDILQRWFVRRGRTAKLTHSFVILSLALVGKRPLKTMIFMLRYLFFAIRLLGKKLGIVPK